MKHAKTAALVAGSVMALGAASPAFAAQAPTGHPAPETAGSDLIPLMGAVHGAADMARQQAVQAAQEQQAQGRAQEQEGPQSPGNSPLGGLSDVTRSLPLIGGLPLGG